MGRWGGSNHDENSYRYIPKKRAGKSLALSKTLLNEKDFKVEGQKTAGDGISEQSSDLNLELCAGGSPEVVMCKTSKLSEQILKP